MIRECVRQRTAVPIKRGIVSQKKKKKKGENNNWTTNNDDVYSSPMSRHLVTWTNWHSGVSLWRNFRIHLKVNNNSSWLKSIQTRCKSWTWPLCFDKNTMLFHFFRSHFPHCLFMLELSTSSLYEISDNANSMTCFQTCPSLKSHDLLFWYSRRPAG